MCRGIETRDAVVSGGGCERRAGGLRPSGETSPAGSRLGRNWGADSHMDIASPPPGTGYSGRSVAAPRLGELVLEEDAWLGAALWCRQRSLLQCIRGRPGVDRPVCQLHLNLGRSVVVRRRRGTQGLQLAAPSLTVVSGALDGAAMF